VDPSGVCYHVFTALKLKNSAAVTLLALPDGLRGLETAEEKAALYSNVLTYAKLLDPEITFEIEAAVPAIRAAWKAADTSPPPSRRASSNGTASPEPQTSSGNSGAHENEGFVEVADCSSGPELSSSLSTPPGSFSREDMERMEEESLRDALMAIQSDPQAMQRLADESRAVTATRLTEGAILSEPAFTILPAYTHRATPKSVAAVQMVVSGCMRPQIPEDTGAGAPRWYDSRGRVAALRLAHWLRVPMQTFAAFEVASMSSAATSHAQPATTEQLHSYHAHGTTWLKIGAAALGGGVLTALTAGLAAPAIVAGLGTMVGMAGGAGVDCCEVPCHAFTVPGNSC
jgi:hypothetical protein